MSVARYSRIPARAAGDQALSRTALRVLVAIGKFVDKDGSAFPSLNTLAESAGLARNNVSAPIAELERLGYVTRSRRTDESGDFASTVYTVNFEDDGVACPGMPGGMSRHATGDMPQHATVACPGMPGGGMSRHALTTHRDNYPLKEPKERDLAPAGSIDGDTVEKDFGLWWDQFPKQRRDDRPRTLALFRKLLTAKTVTLDELMSGVARYAASRDVAEGFACAPLVWLRKGRWALDFESPQPRQSARASRPGAIDALIETFRGES